MLTWTLTRFCTALNCNMVDILEMTGDTGNGVNKHGKKWKLK